MAVITGFSNKKYFDLITYGGELKVVISTDIYETYHNYNKHTNSISRTPVIQLGEPWEIVVHTIYSLGGEISYRHLSKEEVEATISINSPEPLNTKYAAK